MEYEKKYRGSQLLVKKNASIAENALSTVPWELTSKRKMEKSAQLLETQTTS
jgi:hypothetical protein